MNPRITTETILAALAGLSVAACDLPKEEPKPEPASSAQPAAVEGDQPSKTVEGSEVEAKELAPPAASAGGAKKKGEKTCSPGGCAPGSCA